MALYQGKYGKKSWGAGCSVALLSSSLMLTGCNSNNNQTVAPPPPEPTSRQVNLNFEALANGQTINCGTKLTGLGTAGSEAMLEDFRFYLYNLALIKDNGDSVAVTLDQNAWQAGNLALVDFQNKADKCSGADKEIHTTITGTVTDTVSSFVGVRFTVGVPEDRNHTNPAQATTPLNIASLQWSWQSGYKFMRLDVAPIGGISRPSDANFSSTAWNFHLGSTGCTGDPALNQVVTCSNSNRPEVTLSNFNLNTSRIRIDYAALVEASVLGLDEGGPAGCMSGKTDPECNPVFPRIGLSLDTGNADASIVQKVFSVVTP